ncbi:MAG: cell division protein FtsZ [Flavobacteriales bacterium]|nr:cell division protein FtsZ [Flavobacteriales bacterium]
MNQNNISFDLPKNRSNVIKVIGVGGGGSNAVNYMYNQGFNGVDFVVCNTDSQALQNSPVPNKIQLGVTLTEGLGAGADPEIGGQSAQESLAEIESMFNTNTKMVFLTAGMGGGTGTGAAPVIAKLASKLGILTVGIVTIPFQFEGKKRLAQAKEGVEVLREHVDSLIVINNSKLREIYGNLGFKAGFAKADEVLATAAKGISQVITNHYGMNIDLRDAKTVLANSGTAIMGSAVASGDDRAIDAITKALDSPLLNDNKITGAQKVLLLIVSGDVEITLDEIGEINDFIQGESGESSDIIMGVGEDSELGDSISVTIVATGFSVEMQERQLEKEPERKVHRLVEDKKISAPRPKTVYVEKTVEPIVEKKVVHLLEEEPVPEVVIPQVQNNDIEEVRESTIIAKETAPKNIVQENTIEREPYVTKIVEDVVVEKSIMDIADDAIVINELSAVEEPELKVDEPQTTIEFDFEPIEPKEEEVLGFTNERVEEQRVGAAVEEQEVADKRIVHKLEDFEEDIISDLPYIHVDIPFEKELLSNEQVFSDGSKKFNLEDYSNLEEKIENSSQSPNFPIVDTIEEVEEEEMKIVIAQPEHINTRATDRPLNNEVKSTEKEDLKHEVLDPTEVPISKQDEIRRQRQERLRQFNYRFKATNASAIDDLEKQPAYVRAGLDVTKADTMNNSRYSMGNSDDDYVIRSNNSFLHDNVD